MNATTEKPWWIAPAQWGRGLVADGMGQEIESEKYIEIGDPLQKGPSCEVMIRGDNAKEVADVIEAAPELLAALKKVMEWIKNWDPNFAEDDEWPADRDAAKAAIAKAEGNSQ